MMKFAAQRQEPFKVHRPRGRFLGRRGRSRQSRASRAILETSEYALELNSQSNLDDLSLSAGFLDALIEGMLVVDDTGVIVGYNQAAGTLLDAGIQDLVGANLLQSRWSTVYEDGTPVSLEGHPVLATLRTGVPCHNIVFGLDLPTSRLWLRADILPLATERSSRVALMRFIDITPQMHRERNLRLLLGVNRLMVAATEVDDFLENLCSTFVELGRCALASISVSSAVGQGRPEITHAVGVTDFYHQEMSGSSISEAMELDPSRMAMRSGATQVVNSLDALSSDNPWRVRAEKFAIKSALAIPFSLGRRDAVLTLYSAHANSFDELAVEGLEAGAKDIEFGISHVQATTGLASALDGTLAALSQVTDSRDPYTEGHQIHVGALGAAIARELGLNPEMIRLVEQSGKVHDIGKIAIPSEILTRPGKLNTLEYEMIKGHTTVGANILGKASLPWPIAEVAGQHHERLDGSGYPNGLVGEEIILPARIIAVADVVEAMTQHRPYRPALGLDKALAEVWGGAGTLYDAEVVAACSRVFKAGFSFESRDQEEVDQSPDIESTILPGQ
jgi:putative nucleotidyltransferase with HDIG domain